MTIIMYTIKKMHWNFLTQSRLFNPAWSSLSLAWLRVYRSFLPLPVRMTSEGTQNSSSHAAGSSLLNCRRFYSSFCFFRERLYHHKLPSPTKKSPPICGSKRDAFLISGLFPRFVVMAKETEEDTKPSSLDKLADAKPQVTVTDQEVIDYIAKETGWDRLKTMYSKTRVYQWMNIMKWIEITNRFWFSHLFSPGMKTPCIRIFKSLWWLPRELHCLASLLAASL